MAHVLVFAEGRETWYNLFVNDLTERRYMHKMANGGLAAIQPNVREVHLLDISVPEQCIPSLMADLSPYAKDTSRFRGLANLFANLLRKTFRLHSIYDTYPFCNEPWHIRIKNYVLESFRLKPKPKVLEYKPTFEVRHKWVNIIPVGWFEDKFVKCAKERPTYPAGREIEEVELV